MNTTNTTKIDRKNLIHKTRRPLPPPTRRIEPDKGGKYTRKNKHKDKDDRWTEDGLYLPAIYDIVFSDCYLGRFEGGDRWEKDEPFIVSAQYEGFSGDEDRPLSLDEIDKLPHTWVWKQLGEQAKESNL